MYINGTSFKYHKILYISSFYHLLHQPAMNLIWFQSFFELLSFTLQKKNITVRKEIRSNHRNTLASLILQSSQFPLSQSYGDDILGIKAAKLPGMMTGEESTMYMLQHIIAWLINEIILLIIPPRTKFRGYIGITLSVRLSCQPVCPSICLFRFLSGP